MVRRAAAADAAARARDLPGLSVGLHLDFGEWICRDGAWRALYEVVPPDDAGAVAREVSRQIAAFRALTGTNPTHLDSHQHAHRREPARTIVMQAAADLGVPLRHFTAGIQYCGRFYGQTDEGAPLPGVITVASLISILRELPPGISELACHPGTGGGPTSMYRAERLAELRVLCDPAVRAALDEAGIALINVQDARAAGGSMSG
jgi:predicted glycoside hydrolase/deacetylase ChbG (UPF0249 family)